MYLLSETSCVLAQSCLVMSIVLPWLEGCTISYSEELSSEVFAARVFSATEVIFIMAL